MVIESITLRNFRNIAEKQTFRLNPSFTVIIGINGKGKSTILHATRILCGAFFLNIPDVGKRHIHENEIRLKVHGTSVAKQRPVLVEANGYFKGHLEMLTWRRQILENSSSNTSNEADVGIIRNIGKVKYNQVAKEGNDKVDLPVIAYFGTSRAHGDARKKNNRAWREIFKEGYRNWDEMKATGFLYPDWLNSYAILLKDKKEYPKTKEAFFNAIKTANPYIETINDSNGVIWMSVKMEETVSDILPIDLHSDGIRYFTEMVAEIAFRCIVLNGYLKENAIKKTDGVVMIDEIDMHLHPTWQKHVVNDLKNAFPKIQFIATTHSPFIVQSLNSDELINLDRLTDVSLKDMSIEDIAEEVMGIDSESIENKEKYNASKTAIRKIMTSKTEAEAKKEIENISDPVLRAFLELQHLVKNK